MSQTAPQRSSPLICIGLLLLISYFAVNVSQTFAQSRYNRSRLQALQYQVNQLQQRHQQLLQQVTVKQSPQFIESEARNKLDMARPNETIAIFPQTQEVVGQQQTATDQVAASQFQLPANIQAWQKLFW